MQAEAQPGGALPRLGGTPGRLCVEPARAQRSRHLPGAQERRVSPISAPLLGNPETEQDSLQRPQGPGGTGAHARAVRWHSSQGAGHRQGAHERVWAARKGPGTAGSWLPEAPRPASLHLLHAAFRGEPGNSENQLEGSLSWVEKQAPRGKSLVRCQPLNHPTKAARAHGAPGEGARAGHEPQETGTKEPSLSS